MNGLITRLFCAECLLYMVNHGCYGWVSETGSATSAVFYWFRLLHL